MTVNDASLNESGSKLSKVAATSLLMGVTRASSEAYDSIPLPAYSSQPSCGNSHFEPLPGAEPRRKLPIIVQRFVSCLSFCDIEAETRVKLSVCSTNLLNIRDKDVVYAVLLFQHVVDIKAIG